MFHFATTEKIHALAGLMPVLTRELVRIVLDAPTQSHCLPPEQSVIFLLLQMFSIFASHVLWSRVSAQ